ncbi:ABC transporter permease [Actinoplanes rectilineatus]|uniref:ABC transporter permease n=1 Tax=Actinoplanes rectilineatus TaxID=113571 RepID=UPI0005F2EE69|nr:ABC transporter permease [Actinoplanes rectilineatus]
MTAAELAATSIDGDAYGLLLFTVAVGLTLILGVMGVMNLAHGTLYLLGAYLGYALSDGTLLGLVLAAGAALVVGAGGGVLLDVLLRPVHDHRRQAMVTLGIAFLAMAGFNAAFGGSPLPAEPPSALSGSVDLFGYGYPLYRLAFIAVAALIAVALHLVLRHTLTGARLRAVVADPAMAAATGIRTRGVRVGALAVGAALAVTAGALGAPIIGPAPGTDTHVLTLSLIVVVLGGAGNIKATLAAALFVGQVQTVGVALAPGTASFALFVPVLIMLIVKAHRGRAVLAAPAASTPDQLPSPARARPARPTRVAALAGLLILAAAWPALANRYLVVLAATALIYAILAVSTQLLVGVAGLPSFGQVAYAGVGAYTAALLAIHGHTNALLHIAAGALMAAIAAALTAPFLLQARGTAFMLITLMFAGTVALLASQWTSLTGGDEGLQLPAVSVWPGTVPVTQPAYLYWYVLAVTTVTVAAVLLVARSRLALILRGLAGHEARMAALGHRSLRAHTAGYTIAGAVAGIGGALLAALNAYVSPADLGFDTATVVFLAAAIGGTSITGAIAGAFTVIAARDWAANAFGGGPLWLGLLFLTAVYGPLAYHRVRHRTRAAAVSPALTTGSPA